MSAIPQEPEGWRMNCQSTLRRLEMLAGGRCPLHVAPGPLQGDVEEVAREAGWVLAPAAEARAVISFVSDGPLQAPGVGRYPEAHYACSVGRTSEADALAEAREFQVAQRRAFRPYHSLNRIFGLWQEKVPVSPGIKSKVAGIWNGWKLNERVGARMAAVGVAGYEEVFLVRKNLDLPMPEGVSSKDRLYDLLATFFGTGHLPIVGATAASLFTAMAAIPTWQLMVDRHEDFQSFWFVVMLLATLGCLVTEKWAGGYYLAKDPREVVLDETAGMAMTLLFLPAFLWEEAWWMGGLMLGFAFLAFRFFDVFKIGVRWIDRGTWPGTIVWDDLLAGIYAGIATFLASLLLVNLVR